MVATLITKDNIGWINHERLKLNRSIVDYNYKGLYIKENFLLCYVNENKIVSFEEFQQIVNKQTIVELW
jgi:hypothetical protein